MKPDRTVSPYCDSKTLTIDKPKMEFFDDKDKSLLDKTSKDQHALFDGMLGNQGTASGVNGTNGSGRIAQAGSNGQPVGVYPEGVSEEEPANVAVQPDMQGLATEYAHQNKWLAYLPLELVLGKQYKNLTLNLQRFTIPQMEVGSKEVSFRGYTIASSTHVINYGSKEITFDYIVDENWYNYKALYTFTSQLGNFNPVDPAASKLHSTDSTIDIRVWLINHYKKRVLDLVFYDCWIKLFNDVSLDVSSADEVKHSFVCAYSHFEILPAEF